MIHLVQGEATKLEAWSAETRRTAGDVLCLCSPPGGHQSWDSVRRLLPQIEDRLGGERLRTLLQENRVPASFFLPMLDSALSTPEVIECTRLSAHVDSHLSHNWLIQRPLVNLGADMLVKLIHLTDCRLCVTSPLHLDRVTLSVLKAAFPKGLAEMSDVTVGYDRQWSAGTPDASGLMWRYPLSSAHYLLVGLPISSTRTLHGGAVTTTESPPVWSGYGCEQEQACLTLLASRGPLSRSAVERSLSALRQAFAGFGFQGALRLGLALLDHRSALSPEEAAETHGIVALCAHNEQFYSAPDSPLNGFLEHHLRQALTAEQRPAHRIAVLYRLAVTVGRRQKKFEQAIVFADRAVEEARGLRGPDASYQEAWARNIRAYLRARLRDLKGAAADEETAFSLLAQAREGGLASAAGEARDWFTELTMSQAVVCSNLCTLSQYGRDEEAFRHWLEKEAALAALLPGMGRFVSDTSVKTYRRAHRWDLALQEAHKGLQAATGERDGYRRYTFLSDVADLSLRLGDAATAGDAFQQAKVLAGPFIADGGQQTLDLARAVAAVWAGGEHLAESRVALESVNVDGLEDSAAGGAEVAATLGWISALEGKPEEMEARFDRAISLAVSTGSRDILLRVALMAGIANRSIGRIEAARDAWTRGLEIADFTPGEVPDAEITPDLLRCLIGLIDLNPAADDLMRAAFGLVPAALDDGEVWWDLPRWLAAISRSLQPDSSLYREPAVLEALGLLTVLADQRPDCRTLTAAVRASLPNLPSPKLSGEIAA